MDKAEFFTNLQENTKKHLHQKPVVLVGGCFDLLHYGHLKFLQAAKKAGRTLVIALEPDEFIRKSKRREPVHTQVQRQEVLSNLSFVDHVIPLPYLSSYDDYFRLVDIVKPDIIATTEGDPQVSNKEKQAKAIGAKIKTVSSLIPGFSSSAIIQKLE